MNLIFMFPDVDECALQTDNCHFNQECININGSYICVQCIMGYFWDGVSCTSKWSIIFGCAFDENADRW